MSAMPLNWVWLMTIQSTLFLLGAPFKRRQNAIGSTGWFPRRAVQHVFVQMSTMSGFLCHGRNAQSVALRQRLPVMYVAYTFVVKRLLGSDALVGTFFIHPSDSKRESAHHVKPGARS